MLRKLDPKQADLPPPLADDAFAWYLLGASYLHEIDTGQASRDYRRHARQAESAIRRSLQLDPSFARAHRNLAHALFWQLSGETPADQARQDEALRELAEARRLEPALPTAWVEAGAAFRAGLFARAEMLYRQAIEQEPNRPSLARGLALAVVMNPSRTSAYGPVVAEQVERFPEDAELISLYALALARDEDYPAAAAQLEKARALGFQPETVLDRINPAIVPLIQSHGSPPASSNLPLFSIGLAAVGLLVVIGSVVLVLTRRKNTMSQAADEEEEDEEDEDEEDEDEDEEDDS
jgi:tetratricopeptide (TPR) repeat protein